MKKLTCVAGAVLLAAGMAGISTSAVSQTLEFKAAPVSGAPDNIGPVDGQRLNLDQIGLLFNTMREAGYGLYGYDDNMDCLYGEKTEANREVEYARWSFDGVNRWSLMPLMPNSGLVDESEFMRESEAQNVDGLRAANKQRGEEPMLAVEDKTVGSTAPTSDSEVINGVTVNMDEYKVDKSAPALATLTLS